MRLPAPPKETDFHSETHHRSVTSRVGLWLGITFTVCFVTGLLSHAIQHPPTWFFWPSRPINLYRVTQGVHVISGIAAIPLLLAKLWTVFPKLFSRPAARSIVHAIERGSILLLSASAFFELVTGIFNIFQNYPWPFYFPTIHYAIAWVAIGSILVHVAVKLPVIRAGLGERPKRQSDVDGLSRRGFLRVTWLTAGAAVVATAGSTVPFLRGVSVLATRSDGGSQNLPVNRTADHAGVRTKATDPTWRLEFRSPAGLHRFSLDDLRAMPQTRRRCRSRASRVGAHRPRGPACPSRTCCAVSAPNLAQRCECTPWNKVRSTAAARCLVSTQRTR